MTTPELGLPMAVPAQGLPARVRIHEVGAARRPAEREGDRPDGGQGGVHPTGWPTRA